VDDATLLRKSELFQALDDDAMTSILTHVSLSELQRGDRVFDEDDHATALFVVRSGRVAIAKRAIDDKESIVALMEAGDLFGEMSLFDGLERSATARALEISEVLVVPYDPITKVLEDRPTLLWHIVALLARRLRTTDAALADSMFLDVTGRTAKRLLELAGGLDEFSLPVTQEELAGMVGASRERVNKALSQFLRLGWISVSDRRYKILLRTELERRAR
jgi:CRP/FNR family cyclic AMP-dependent transcriptional regulator